MIAKITSAEAHKWWQEATPLQRNRQIHEVLGHTIYSVAQMRTHAEEVWAKQPGARKFLQGYTWEPDGEGDGVFVQEVPNYTEDISTAHVALFWLRDAVVKNPGLWGAYCAGIEKFCSPDIERVGWGACYFLYADIPDVLCYGVWYAQIVVNENQQAVTNERNDEHSVG